MRDSLLSPPQPTPPQCLIPRVYFPLQAVVPVPAALAPFLVEMLTTAPSLGSESEFLGRGPRKLPSSPSGSF